MFRRLFGHDERFATLQIAVSRPGAVPPRPFRRKGRAPAGANESNAQLQLASVDSLLVATDLPEYPHPDRVFPVFDDEALVLSDMALALIDEVRPKTILDLGTGSGVIAFRLARRGHAVVATDINPRCVRFACANAQVNGIKNVSVRHGDLYEPVRGSEFDLIVMNPPFLPVPPCARFHLAGNGGPDGMVVIRRLLAEAALFLSPEGSLLFTTVSLSREGRPLAMDFAAPLLRRGLHVSAAAIYPDPLLLDAFHPLFADCHGYTEWLTKLRALRFDALQYLVVHVSRRRLTPLHIRGLRRTQYSGGWGPRLARYRLWLHKNA